MSVKMDFDSLGRDGLREITDRGLSELLVNVQDENTEAKKARKLTIEISIMPNEHRNFFDVTYATKLGLVPVKPIVISGMMDADENGEPSIFIPEIGTNPAQHELPIDNPKVTNLQEVASNE